MLRMSLHHCLSARWSKGPLPSCLNVESLENERAKLQVASKFWLTGTNHEWDIFAWERHDIQEPLDVMKT